MKCRTKYCRNESLKKRRICAKCKSRRYKKQHPMRYFYNASRNNARRRGHEFDMTFEEYKQLWKDHGKKPGNGWHIDRIDVRKGYTYDNCQILSGFLNVMKWFEEDRFMIDFHTVKVKP